MIPYQTPVRNTPAAELLQKALSGEEPAAEIVVEQLASPYPRIRQEILEYIHLSTDNRVWQHLLNCLARAAWSETFPLKICNDPSAAQRLDISIVDAFVEDLSEAEKASKNVFLRGKLECGANDLRNAAAYLAGLRGDAHAIPILIEMLDKGDRRWQLRSIQAISSIPSSLSAKILIKVLVKDHEIYHQEARRGLSNLGNLAEEAWIEALDNPDPHIGWHAARGLTEMGNYRAISLIADGLCNDNASIRWVSSDLLAHIGIKAVPQILQVIHRFPLSEGCRQSAYHALLSIKSYRAQECLKPLVVALSSPSTKHIARTISGRLLNDWDRLERYISGKLQSIDSLD